MKNELLSMDMETVSPSYLKMAQYAAGQCTGCSDSPMILAFKAQQAMLEAHEKGENPLVNSICSLERQFLRKYYFH